MNDRYVDIFLIVAVIIAFIAKIIGVIKISWLWFLSPIWIPLLVGAIIAFGLFVMMTVEYFIDNKRRIK